MTARLLLMTLMPFLLQAGEIAPALVIRGKQQSVSLLPSASGSHERAVLFLPGDGGWRGLAITIGQTISQWGYDVYGLDTKRYLEGFSEGESRLAGAVMQRDVREFVAWIRSRGARSVTLLGWSEGAGMAALAAQDRAAVLDGVLTMGLPESAVLGWNWKDTLSVMARREPDQPHFLLRTILPGISPTPLWMIHGSQDAYTSPEIARGLYALAREPKRLVEIEGGNHRFDGKREELFRAIHEGLTWVRTAAR